MNAYNDSLAKYRNNRSGEQFYCQKIPPGNQNCGMLLASPVVRSPNTGVRLYTVEEFEARFKPVAP